MALVFVIRSGKKINGKNHKTTMVGTKRERKKEKQWLLIYYKIFY